MALIFLNLINPTNTKLMVLKYIFYKYVYRTYKSTCFSSAMASQIPENTDKDNLTTIIALSVF
jgi:hypothetical protein